MPGWARKNTGQGTAGILINILTKQSWVNNFFTPYKFSSCQITLSIIHLDSF